MNRPNARAVAGLLACLAASCSPPLPLDGRICPCATGYLCCEARNVCLRPEETCSLDGGTRDAPGPESGSQTDSGGAAGIDRASREIGPVGASESWTGYVENYQFSSGSDALKLTFATSAAGEVVGSVVFGMGTPPPRATDPETGYPPGIPSSALHGYLAEGFAYDIVTGMLAGRRLKLRVAEGSLWSGWCALQPPPVDGSEGCLPNWGSTLMGGECSQTNPATGEVRKLNCEKLALCRSMVCKCDPSGCRASEDAFPIELDVAISGTFADGSIRGTLGDHNVHFIRDP